MLLIIIFGIMSSYTGYVLYQLKIKYMRLHSFADAAELVFGRPGRWAVETLQVLVFVFLMAAHILTFGVMLNVLTEHGACTILFTVCGTIISFICTLRRTLKHVSYLSITCEYTPCLETRLTSSLSFNPHRRHCHYGRGSPKRRS